MSDAETAAGWYEKGGDLADEDWIAHWGRHWNPDIEWRAIEGAPDDVGAMHGVERLMRYYGEWMELFEDLRTTVRSAQDVGDRVVLALHVEGKSRSTGMPLELDYGVLLEFDDEGRVLAGREFPTFDQALTAAESAAINP